MGGKELLNRRRGNSKQFTTEGDQKLRREKVDHPTLNQLKSCNSGKRPFVLTEWLISQEQIRISLKSSGTTGL